MSPPPRPRASSDATSAKPQSSPSTPPAAAPTRSPTSPGALYDFAASLDPTCFVVCEATGGYERDLLAALLADGVPAHRADARKVKAFIRSFGTLGKSDAIDASALARYGRDRYAELPLWSAREPERLRLQALVLARRDLVKDRLAYANRRAAPAAEPSTLISRRSSKASTRKSRRSKPISTPCAPGASRSPRPSKPWSRSKASVKRPPRPSSPSCPSSVRSPAARPPPSQALRPIPIKAARPTPIAEPAAEDPKSNESSSWLPSPPANTIQTSRPSMSASSRRAKSPSSP